VNVPRQNPERHGAGREVSAEEVDVLAPRFTEADDLARRAVLPLLAQHRYSVREGALFEVLHTLVVMCPALCSHGLELLIDVVEPFVHPSREARLLADRRSSRCLGRTTASAAARTKV
jgi:hypothetical protein